MKRVFATLVVVAAAAVSLLVPVSGQAAKCGTYMGQKIVTHGGLSCRKAKSVYRAFQNGHTPKGWVCGLSAGGCNKGSKGFTFR